MNTYAYGWDSKRGELTTEFDQLVGILRQREGLSYDDAYAEMARRDRDLFMLDDRFRHAIAQRDPNILRNAGAPPALVERFSVIVDRIDAFQEKHEAERFAESAKASLSAKELAYIDKARDDADDAWARLIQDLDESIEAVRPELRRDVRYRLATEIAGQRRPDLAKEWERHLDAQIARMQGGPVDDR